MLLSTIQLLDHYITKIYKDIYQAVGTDIWTEILIWSTLHLSSCLTIFGRRSIMFLDLFSCLCFWPLSFLGTDIWTKGGRLDNSNISISLIYLSIYNQLIHIYSLLFIADWLVVLFRHYGYSHSFTSHHGGRSILKKSRQKQEARQQDKQDKMFFGRFLFGFIGRCIFD